jgi:uncharacterized membrane protein YcaP (DUF421 family)
MDKWFNINWQELFIPSIPVAELILRGSLVYLVLFSILRFIPNRQLGTLAISDLLVVVLFAEAAQNAMASNYTSITEGAILVGTVIFWSYFLNWLGYQFPIVQRFLNPPPLPLVKNGYLLYRNMRRELITEDELMSQLRQQGVESLADVKAAYMESDGSISVITYDSKLRRKPKQKAG